MKLVLYTNTSVVQYEAPTIHAHPEGKDVMRFILHKKSGLKTITSNLPFILES